MSSPAEIANMICSGSMAGVGSSINLINAYSFTNLKNSKEYQHALLRNCTNYVDGKPLSLYLGLRDGRSRINSRGMEIFAETLTKQRGKNIRNFFVYFERSDANLLLEFVQDGISAKNAVLIPVSDSLDLVAISRHVRKVVQTSQPHIVWIMLGSPKQEIVSSLISNSLMCPVVGLGGVIDFVTGKVPEAPKIMQLIYLEWLFRFAREPFRLLKRYTIGNLVFLLALKSDFFFTVRSKQKRVLTRDSEVINFYLSKLKLDSKQ
jgi:N-acetylglucosaminyldiphosphoundecaprenol N-acetyl-beta-D-mannosaminyltransferase